MSIFKGIKKREKSNSLDKATVEVNSDKKDEEQKVNADSDYPEEYDLADTGVDIDDITNSTMDEGKMVDRLMDYFTTTDPSLLDRLNRGKLPREEFDIKVHAYINTSITKDTELHDRIFKAFSSFVFNYDILDSLIDSDNVTDIRLLAYDRLRIKVIETDENGKTHSRRITSDLKFRDPQHFNRFIEHAAMKNKVTVAMNSALKRFTDTKSNDKYILRFNATNGVVNSSENYIMCIRKIPKIKYTTEEFIHMGFMTEDDVAYFRKRIADDHGFLIVGRGGSGKTHLLNWILDEISENKSVFVSQESEELFSNVHPEIVFEHVVEAVGDGRIEYSIKDEIKNALTQDIDVMIIGEIKGEEAYDLINAIYTGAQGMATAHASSAEDGINKIVHYAKYQTDLSEPELKKMMMQLDTIVFMKDFNVSQIIEIEDFDNDKEDFIYKSVK